MRIGISCYDLPAVEQLELAIAAERLGFDSIWLGEHVVTPVAVGSHRGGTTMQLIVESEVQPVRRTQRIANRLLAFLVGGFAARTAEGALRDELDSLAQACADQLMVRPRTSAA